jgi:hypothetical protein
MKIIVEFSVEPVGFVDFEPDLGADGFVNPGRSEHEVGTDLLEVFHGRFHRFGKIDGDPGGHGHTKGVHLLADPGKGQEREVLVGIRQGVGFGQLQAHADKILVGQHGPLGQACGARRQAEVADLVGGAFIHQGLE